MYLSLEFWDTASAGVNVLMWIGKFATMITLWHTKELRGVNGWSCFVFLSTCTFGVLKSFDLGLTMTGFTLIPMMGFELANCVLICKKRTTHWFYPNRPRFTKE